MTADELDAYFKSIELPAKISINRSTEIINVRRFIDGHLAVIRNYGDNPSYSLFMARLMEVKGIIEDTAAG